MIMDRLLVILVTAVAVLLLAGCNGGEERTSEGAVVPTATSSDRQGQSERVLAATVHPVFSPTDAIASPLRPVPLLTLAQERTFQRFRNADHLGRARALGIPQPVNAAAIERHQAEGRLVPLGETRYWIVRDLDYSVALATPDVHALLEEIGRRFQDRIARLGLPPLRMEVTSVLRTAEDQARLRRTNPNAAVGESTHQFGTTIDIAYSSFAAPLEPVLNVDASDAPWMEPYLRRIEGLAAETGAARMSRELKAILGQVLIEMQNEGMVMVTLEIRQPVYHMTVARRF
jgi:hypothetical protein